MEPTPRGLPESLQELLRLLERLPGIGPRSAERLGLYLVQSDAQVTRTLAQALLKAKDRVQCCNQCGGLTETQPCLLCVSPQRDPRMLCVVERAVDILSLEKAGVFRGRYHVLGGRISPLNGIGPDDLRIRELEARLSHPELQEIVLALGADVEGDATTFYLAQRLARKGLRLTRLAHGLPAGSGLEFADELTLSQALEGRRELP
jgi:recombination protein RecR